MYGLSELIMDTSSNFYVLPKIRMSYARHGHSCCNVNNAFILVTGSKKNLNYDSISVELYNLTSNVWI